MSKTPEHQSPPAGRGSSPFPPWIKRRLPANPDPKVQDTLKRLHLDTVCRGARCPNQGECYQKKRATFLLMGPSCTRYCGFCAVDHHPPAPLDPDEPARIAQAVKELGLRHAVVTSTTRDDLEDGGANHFAQTVQAIREAAPSVTIEILTPDFGGNQSAWEIAAASAPDVFNHNVETVPRLYSTVRPEGDYQMSRSLLRFVKSKQPKTHMAVKSGMMVGFGETTEEVLEVAQDLRHAGVDMLTIGQYLRPGPNNLPVEEFITPDDFATLEMKCKALGFLSVAAGPFVRSSYNAEEAYTDTQG